MKLKYYLRGAGIGIIVSTFIFSIAFAFYKPTLSDEEIMKEATKLGMVSKSEDSDASSKDIKTQENNENQTKDDDGSQSKNGDKSSEEEAEGTEVITFSVNSGDTSSVVAGHLKEMGLVDDADAFDKFLSEQDLDNLILPGEYTIPKDSSFLDIATILTSKKK